MKISTTFLSLLVVATTYGQPASLRQLGSKLSTSHGAARIDLLNELSWGYRRLEPQKAQTFAMQAEELSERAHYQKGLAYAHKNLGFLHNLRGETDLAKQYLFRSRQEFHQLNDLIQEGNIDNLLGLNYWDKGDYEAAIYHYKLADSIFAAAHDSIGQEIVLSNLGIIYYEQARYDTALAYYTQVLKKVIARNDPLTLSHLYTNIGLVYQDMGNFPKAIGYHRLSLAIDTRENNLVGKGQSFTNLSECYFGLKQYDQALDYTLRGLKLHEQMGEAKGVERSNLNVAHIEAKKGNTAEAVKAVQKALRTGYAIGDKRGILMGLALLGSIQIDAGNCDEAIRNLLTASEMASTQHSLKYQSAVALLLAKAYEKLGDGNRALASYRQSVVYSASLSETRTENKLAELEIFMETRALKSRIDQLQAKNRAASQKKKIAVATGIGLTVLLVLVYFSQRAWHRRKHNRMQLQLVSERSRRKALAHNVSEIEREAEASRQELLRFIRTLTETREQQPSAEVTSPPQEDLEKLGNSRILTEDDWQEFRKRFNHTFPLYLSSLREKFPAITTAELRLAALLKLQLSSRDISAVLGISAESVKKSRQRLRKKLALAATENLEEFLKSV